MSDQQAEVVDEVIGLDEFRRMPEEDEYLFELVRGRVVREPRPGAQHGILVEELIWRLSSHVRGQGIGRVVTETGFLLTVEPPTVRGPDLAYIAAARIPSEGIPTGFWPMPPDLAVEVLSPWNTSAEISKKILEYLESGTRLVLVVDPATRSVGAYRSRLDIRLLTEGDTLEGYDVFPGFRLPVSELFETLRSPGV